MPQESASDRIAKLIEQENWKLARRTILQELRKTPYHHWLIDRLSETYYSEGKIARALTLIERAYALNPDCPLVLWDYANTLEEVGQLEAALSLYQRLMAKGLQETACGECGEGTEWAKALLCDCAYRMAIVCHTLDKPDEAFAYKLTHLSMRDQGAESIYKDKEVQEQLDTIKPKTTSAANSSGPLTPSCGPLTVPGLAPAAPIISGMSHSGASG
jgi:tetratricopeptide (TPR) repeat protein